MRAIYYTNKFNIVSYVSAALSFVGYPLAFYVYYKFKLPLYMNVGAALIFVPVFMIAVLISGCAVNAYIDDCTIIIERYLLKAIWPNRAQLSYRFSEILKIELLRSDGKCFHNIYFSNRQYLSLTDVPLSYVDDISRCYAREIIELPMPGAKEKRSIALVFGAIILDIILIFIAIYLAT